MKTAKQTIAGCLVLIALSMAAQSPPASPVKPTAAEGPLRVHPQNPRYFTDGITNADASLRAVYLGGHQIFVDLQDNAFNKEWTKDMSRPGDPAAKTRLLDWDGYLDFAERLDFNYLRGWIIWSTGSGTAAPPHRIASPMPFLRTGPGTANDGKLKFDLFRFDESFFQRLRGRARSLQQRGVYVSVMLFELYGFLDGEAVNGQRLWEGNPFNGANNINGVDVDRNQNRMGEEFFSLDDPELVKLQKTYVEKMLDSLNDLDNILWEICNEAPAAAFAWQCEMVRHLKACEARKPKQHLVLLSPDGWKPGGWATTPEAKFITSSADCIATTGAWCDQENPKAYQIQKPVFMDLDHVSPGSHDPALVWKAFTRGYHFSLYDHPFEQPQNESSAWQVVRANIRQTRLLSCRVADMARMRPREDLASTGFCLANEGQDYIVYASRQEEIRVQGLEVGREYQCEWFDPAKGSIDRTTRTRAGASTLTLSPPCTPAVLFLKLDQSRTSGDSAVAPGAGGELGMDRSSPVILDNDAFTDDWTLEYALARASQGKLDLRGVIGCKAGRDGHTIYLTAEQTCAEARQLIDLANATGLKIDIQPTLGAHRGMARPPSGRIEDTEPVRSPGSDLIVAEARKATPEKPLVVLVGGHLADVASAYLTDSSITNRIRVFYIGGQASQVCDYNSWCDYWAFWITASRLPMVCLPIEALFSPSRPQMAFDRFGELPDNALGRYLREKRPRLEKLYPGGENDLAMAIYLLRPELVRTTQRVRLEGWAKDDKGDDVPVVKPSAEGNLLYITEADGIAGGIEWLSAIAQSPTTINKGTEAPTLRTTSPNR